MNEHPGEMSDEDKAIDRWENEGGNAELAQQRKTGSRAWSLSTLPQSRCCNQTETPSQRRLKPNDKLNGDAVAAVPQT